MTAAPCVVDTSAWIEWLADTALGKRLGPRFPDKPQWIVPTIVQLELSKWLVREVGEDQADQVIAYTQKCVVVALDTVTALLAADFHREYKLATADAIVYATARRQGATLLTCDAHFEGLPGVTLFSRSGGKD
jgi:predicted nucleic acid-binding protein